MPEFDFLNALGADKLPVSHFGVILLRLCVAAVLGALIAYRPWRRVLKLARPKIETAQTQTMIAIAGALVTAIIADNLARAFGLVGLGAFIRFRSGIKDPRDATVMFVMIGIGMACGLGTVPIALVGAGFVGVVLAAFDITGRTPMQTLRVRIFVEDAERAYPAIRRAYPEGRFIEAPSRGSDKGRVVIEIGAKEGVDAASIVDVLGRHDVPGVQHVVLEDD